MRSWVSTALEVCFDAGCASIVILVTPMQIHLRESKSKKPSVSRLGLHSLGLYLMALAELRDDHPEADLSFQYFERAQVQEYMGSLGRPADDTSNGEIQPATQSAEDYNESNPEHEASDAILPESVCYIFAVDSC